MGNKFPESSLSSPMSHITSAFSENFSEPGLGQSHREVLQFTVAYEK